MAQTITIQGSRANVAVEDANSELVGNHASRPARMLQFSGWGVAALVVAFGFEVPAHRLKFRLLEAKRHVHVIRTVH